MKSESGGLCVFATGPRALLDEVFEYLSRVEPEKYPGAVCIVPQPRAEELGRSFPALELCPFAGKALTRSTLGNELIDRLRERCFETIVVVVNQPDGRGYLRVFLAARMMGARKIMTYAAGGRYEELSMTRWGAAAIGPRLLPGRLRAKWDVLLQSGELASPSRWPLLARYVLFDRETTNFTYDIANREELDAWLGSVLDVPVAEVCRLRMELESDVELRQSLERRLSTRADRNPTVHYGRRIGWYVLVRLHRPRVVIETGVADGLGTSILGRALFRNREEGFEGMLHAVDVVPGSGWLLDPGLAGDCRIHIEDSRTVLPRILAEHGVDLFLHDSEHSYEHESMEFRAVLPHAQPGALLVSDNAHCCPALKELCLEKGMDYHFFEERSQMHFYRGAGIGLARVR